MRDIFVQALKSALVGLANGTIGLAAISAMSLLDTPPLWANLAGYGIGLALSFMLSAAW